MAVRNVMLAGLGLVSWLAVGASHAQEPVDDAAVDDWAVTVIDLDYANAEEVAALLAEILPPNVRVVPYYATNSLIFSGDAAAIRELVGEDDAGARRDSSDTEERDDAEPTAIGASITARAR